MASPLSSWRIHHTAVRVRDFAAAEAWFTKVLEWKLVRRWTSGTLELGYFSPTGDPASCIEVIAGGEPQSDPLPRDLAESMGSTGWHHIGIEVDSIEDSIAELARHGVVFLAPPPGVADRAHFLDPFGTVFELRSK